MRQRLNETIAEFEGVKARNEFMAELIEAFDIAAADGDAGVMVKQLDLYPIDDPKNRSLLYGGTF